MSRRCQLTGRGPKVANHVSHAHNVSKRRQHINLQRVRVLVDGRVMHMKVSTKAIKSGMITRPPIRIRKRTRRALAPQLKDIMATIDTTEEEVTPGFFSEESVVTRIFKPKKKAVEAEEEETLATPKPEAEKAAAPTVPSGPTAPDILSAETIAEFKDSKVVEDPDGKPPESMP